MQQGQEDSSRCVGGGGALAMTCDVQCIIAPWHTCDEWVSGARRNMWLNRVKCAFFLAPPLLRKTQLKFFLMPIAWKGSSVGEIFFQNWNPRWKKSRISIGTYHIRKFPMRHTTCHSGFLFTHLSDFGRNFFVWNFRVCSSWWCNKIEIIFGKHNAHLTLFSHNLKIDITPRTYPNPVARIYTPGAL